MQSKGEESQQRLQLDRPQPDLFQQDKVRPDPPQETEEKEGDFQRWVWKPFKAVVDSFNMIKGRYATMEQALVSISRELKVEALNALEYIKTLLKV